MSGCSVVWHSARSKLLFCPLFDRWLRGHEILLSPYLGDARFAQRQNKSGALPPLPQLLDAPLKATKGRRMSKKTRKKTPDTASGRSASKNAGAKTGKPRTSAATKSRAPATKKASKKVPAAAKHATTATRSKPKATATPVRMVATLEEGSPAPAFLLPRDGGQSVALTDYAGRKLVIFFYPRANTPGCTLEAADFSRHVSAFAASQTAVLGVSAELGKSPGILSRQASTDRSSYVR